MSGLLLGYEHFMVACIRITTILLKPGFQIVVPVARIVSVASNFWKQQERSYGNARAINEDDPCDINDQSSEIDSSSIHCLLHVHIMAASNSNNTSTFIEEIQRYECLYNKFSKDYKKRRTRENAWETIGQKFGLTAETVPETDAFFDVLSSSSSQNITWKQITSQVFFFD